MEWLKANRLFHIPLLITYYLLVVLPHEQVGIWIAQTLDEPLGREKYNLIILAMGVLGLTAYLFAIWKGSKINPKEQRRINIYLLFTLALIVTAFNVLLVVNVEIIHFLQYAILAILLFPLFSNYRDTLFFAVLLGILDEAYQYWVLAPNRTDYFDFNDVIIDLLGATLGLFLIWSVGVRDSSKPTKWYKTPAFIGFTTFSIFIIALMVAGMMAIYPTPDMTDIPFLWVKKVQEGFWTIVHPNVKFHVVRPFWGVAITTFLFLLYSQFVFVNKKTS